MTGTPADQPRADGPGAQALLEEALRKAAVLWVAPAGHRPVPVWLARSGTTVYVLTGGREQQVPGLAAAASATVSARSREDRALLVTWGATVTPVPPGTAEWDEAVRLLLPARLNLPDADDAGARARWAAECALVRLTPDGEVTPRPHDRRSAAEGDR